MVSPALPLIEATLPLWVSSGFDQDPRAVIKNYAKVVGDLSAKQRLLSECNHHGEDRLKRPDSY
jgi:hypothetical protein